MPQEQCLQGNLRCPYQGKLLKARFLIHYTSPKKVSDLRLIARTVSSTLLSIFQIGPDRGIIGSASTTAIAARAHLQRK
jgi:hypothetical protein